MQCKEAVSVGRQDRAKQARDTSQTMTAAQDILAASEASTVAASQPASAPVYELPEATSSCLEMIGFREPQPKRLATLAARSLSPCRLAESSSSRVFAQEPHIHPGL